jgi:hypothetical protein
MNLLNPTHVSQKDYRGENESVKRKVRTEEVASIGKRGMDTCQNLPLPSS